MIPVLQHYACTSVFHAGTGTLSVLLFWFGWAMYRWSKADAIVQHVWNKLQRISLPYFSVLSFCILSVYVCVCMRACVCVCMCEMQFGAMNKEQNVQYRLLMA